MGASGATKAAPELLTRQRRKGRLDAAHGARRRADLFELSSPERRAVVPDTGLPEWRRPTRAGRAPGARRRRCPRSERDLVPLLRLSAGTTPSTTAPTPSLLHDEVQPKLCDTVAGLPGLAHCHPAQPTTSAGVAGAAGRSGADPLRLTARRRQRCSRAAAAGLTGLLLIGLARVAGRRPPRC